MGEGRSDGGVLHLHLRGQARYPVGGRRREDEPPGEGRRVRANAGDDELQDDELVERDHLYVSRKSHSLPSTQRNVASFPLM